MTDPQILIGGLGVCRLRHLSESCRNVPGGVSSGGEEVPELVRGFGYEITASMSGPPTPTLWRPAANAGIWDAVRTRIRALFDDPAARRGFVASVIG